MELYRVGDHIRKESVNAVSTTELCKIIGIHFSAKQVKAMALVTPYMETGNGCFWLLSDVPIIASGIAQNLLKVAAQFQESLNQQRIDSKVE